MKPYIYSLIIITFFTVYSCKTSKTGESVFIEYSDPSGENSNKGLSFKLLKGKSFNHPTFVIWIENMNGEYQRTLFITKSFATGIFGHGMLNDTAWSDKEGPSYQPAALPYWAHKKGLINGKELIPNKDNPYTDAFTGATPLEDFKFDTGLPSPEQQYKILVEVNQTWDWNEYWTNSKYPGNNDYFHSAQPSVVYSVSLNSSDSIFHLNPIGHGDPKGETGKLFTDLSTMSTALEIFESIQVVIKR